MPSGQLTCMLTCYQKADNVLEFESKVRFFTGIQFFRTSVSPCSAHMSQKTKWYLPYIIFGLCLSVYIPSTSFVPVERVN